MPPTAAAAGGAKAYLYDAEGHDREVPLNAELLEHLHERALLWIDVEGRAEEDIRRAAAPLKLDRTSVGDLLKPRPLPRLDNYGAYLQFSLLVPSEAVRPSSVATEAPASRAESSPKSGSGHSRLDFIVGDNWLLTVHEENLQFLQGFRAQDKAETEIGALSAQALTASLLDWHLESFFKEVSRIELAVDRLDERILAQPSSEDLLERILAIRRRTSRLRRLLVAQRPVFYGLSRPDQTRVAESAAAGLFDALASRFERAVDEVEHTRDLVVGCFELFTSRSAQQTNELVKALTFFTVIIGSAAAIAGVFGMNFDPPFFQSGSIGFFAVTFGLAALALAAWVIGRRRRWI